MKYGFVLWDEKNTDCKTSLGIESYRDVIVVVSEEVFTEAMFRVQSRVKKKNARVVYTSAPLPAQGQRKGGSGSRQTQPPSCRLLPALGHTPPVGPPPRPPSVVAMGENSSQLLTLKSVHL